jgi:hypothetical protein
MERNTGSLRDRLRAALRAAHSDDVDSGEDVTGHRCTAARISPAPTADEVFVCEGCFNELPVSERSRVAIGRCRACA